MHLHFIYWNLHYPPRTVQIDVPLSTSTMTWTNFFETSRLGDTELERNAYNSLFTKSIRCRPLSNLSDFDITLFFQLSTPRCRCYSKHALFFTLALCVKFLCFRDCPLIYFLPLYSRPILHARAKRRRLQ